MWEVGSTITIVKLGATPVPLKDPPVDNSVVKHYTLQISGPIVVYTPLHV